MTQCWTDDSQTRLKRLRDKELAGTLTKPEQAELAALMAQVEAEEAQTLAPEMGRLHAEAAALEAQLATVDKENDELARLLALQHELAGDIRRLLALRNA